MGPDDYQALFKVWRDRQLTVRVAYSLFAQNRGKELADFRSLTQLLPMGMGDDMLRFNGIGERVTFGMYNNDKPTPEQQRELFEAAKWAAERGLTLNAHWHNDNSVGLLLEVFEQVHKEVPIHRLRWAIAHLNDASAATLERMKSLGMGWAVQDAMYFDGERFEREKGTAAARRAPPVKTALKIGVAVGAGTDAHRVASYNPFVALRWFLDGKTVGGTSLRGPDETPSRLEALRLYTIGSAWFAHAEQRRGSLEAGKLADLAVLNRDYLTIPVEQIGAIESILTMVGGKIVYTAAPFTALENR
jgi:predicted amidohydrolase YtcJ